MPNRSSSVRLPYGERPTLSKPEVMRWLRIGRETLKQRIASGDYQTIQDGKRVKVLTQSILDHITRAAR